MSRLAPLAFAFSLILAACGGDDFEAQVAAAEAANDYATVIKLWDTRAQGGDT